MFVVCTPCIFVCRRIFWVQQILACWHNGLNSSRFTLFAYSYIIFNQEQNSERGDANGNYVYFMMELFEAAVGRSRFVYNKKVTSRCTAMSPPTYSSARFIIGLNHCAFCFTLINVVYCRLSCSNILKSTSDAMGRKTLSSAK